MRRLFVVAMLLGPGVASARPASKGAYAEAGGGATLMLGDGASWAAPGPALSLRVGYDLFGWLSLGVAADASTHEATVPPPPEGEYVQLYRGRADARLTVRVDMLALYGEGGVGAAMLSSNVLAKVGVQDPGESLSVMFAGGGGVEYQLQNRHYALGVGADYWLAPGFASLSGLEVRAFLRYTYGGSH